jgi:hypothetical protein
VVGLLLSVGIFVPMFISLVWFPGFLTARNKWWLDFLFFSGLLFSIVISRNWEFHRQFRFWASIIVMAIVHTTGVLLFIIFVRELNPIQYAILIYFEFVIGSVFLKRFMRRLGSSAPGVADI